MKKMLLLLSVFAIPALAGTQTIFDRYETVRQALVKADVTTVQSSARELAAAAKSAKLTNVATQASALASAATIKDARVAFDRVSQQLIAYRDTVSGNRPIVVYCSMEKKSWLQPAAAPIANPYVESTMRSCGQVVKR